MKTYRAQRTGGRILVSVHNSVSDLSRELLPGPSQKLWNHSPDGFEWGYGGSGPAQLALAILLDFTGDDKKAWRAYQTFKDDKIATAPLEGFTITGREINEWMVGQCV